MRLALGEGEICTYNKNSLVAFLFLVTAWLTHGAYSESQLSAMDPSQRRLLLSKLSESSSSVTSLLGGAAVAPGPSTPILPLYRLRAQPWTNVTTNDHLVSHLISYHFTWDAMFSLLIDRDCFLEAMARGDLECSYCSPFLVNSMLALACVWNQLHSPKQ